MKKFITFLIATFFASMVFANVYCPQTIKCSASKCNISTGWQVAVDQPDIWPEGIYNLYGVFRWDAYDCWVIGGPNGQLIRAPAINCEYYAINVPENKQIGAVLEPINMYLIPSTNVKGTWWGTAGRRNNNCPANHHKGYFVANYKGGNPPVLDTLRCPLHTDRNWGMSGKYEDYVGSK